MKQPPKTCSLWRESQWIAVGSRRIGGTAIKFASTQRRPQGDGRNSFTALIPVAALGLFFMMSARTPVESEPSVVAAVSDFSANLPASPEIPIVEFAQPPESKAEPELQPALPQSTNWQFVEVSYGDTLSEMFAELELDPADLARLLRSGEEAQILNAMKAGYKLGFRLDDSGDLDEFRLIQSPLRELAFKRDGQAFGIESIRHTPRVETNIKGGTVYSSLLAAAEREQVPPTQSMRMVDIFGGKIDFMLDTQPGDQFTIFYEQQFLEDEYVGEGDMLVARFVNRGKEHLAVRYENADGRTGYYSPDGNSMRTGMMRNPLDVFRISSHFNPKRLHPILNQVRPHEGTDYAAPAGTPVRATSDGNITRASRYGSYGNIVIVAHAGGFETRYAHLSRFADGMKPGVRVRQGDVIGYVGSTGAATGPHLHYEVLKDGVPRNPARANELLPSAPGIAADEMGRFRSHTENLLAQFDARDRELVGRSAGVSAD